MAGIKSALLGLLFAGAAVPALAAPLDAYGKLPTVEGVEISPDGARLAIIVTDGEKRAVQIQTLADHKIERVLPAGDAKLRALMWVDPTHLVVLRTTTAEMQGYTVSKREFAMGFEYNVADNTAHAILTGTNEAPNTFGGPEVRVVDGKPALFVHSERIHGFRGTAAIYRIDPDKGLGSLVDVGSEDADSLVLGVDGHAAAETTWNETSKQWTLRLRQGGGWRQVRAETTVLDTPALIGLGRDGKSILVGEKKDGHNIVRELSPEGVWSAPLDLPEDSGDLLFDPVRHNLVGYLELAGDEEKTVFFNPKDQQVWGLVERAYPGQLLKPVSWSDDRQQIVVLADSPTEGAGYALIDLKNHHADWISNTYDKIAPADISPRKSISFKAADGTELTGYLTLPNGKAAKGLPLVVLPHGGPQARDEPGFDWLAQGVASRGYAVLQVNYRGSDGFGVKFVEAGYGEWGGKMQTDLSDGVRWLASQGTIDPKRVCIFGASYGGYAALAGPTLDPGVYRCAVSYAGPADLHAMVAWSQSHAGEQSEKYWLRFMGAKSIDDHILIDRSPAAHIQKVSVPMLVIHGKDDTVVPLEQSRMMVNDMKAAGKPVDLLVLDSTDHWLTRGSTRIAMLKATMDFIEKNNPPN